MKFLFGLLIFSQLSLAQTATAPAATPAANPVVIMETNMGTIEIELDQVKAPVTVKNFLAYVNDKFYDGTIFHRVINNFMVQGGGFVESMKEKPTRAPIKNEAANGLRNDTGTVAMARTSDPHSASSQFFINVNDNSFLNHTAPNNQGYGYAVFGKVVNGMHVVNRMKMVKTGTIGMHSDVPMDAIIIKSARLKGETPAAPAAAPEKKSKKK